MPQCLSLSILCPLEGVRWLGSPSEAGFLFSSDGPPDPAQSEATWAVHSASTLHIGPRASVFRAQIARPHQSRMLDAVLKMDVRGRRETAFLNEERAYAKAERLQGSVLPVLYGRVQARLSDGVAVTCLVLEYCGEPMERELWQVENPFMSNILLCVAALHAEGVTHGDLYTKNILSRNGAPVLIDLECSQCHKCEINIRTVGGTIMPTVDEYGCAELHNLICRMQLWQPRSLPFCDVYLVKDELKSEADIITWIPPHADPDARARFMERARALWDDVREERMLTYGSTDPPGRRTRLDVVQTSSRCAVVF